MYAGYRGGKLGLQETYCASAPLRANRAGMPQKRLFSEIDFLTELNMACLQKLAGMSYKWTIKVVPGHQLEKCLFF